MYSVINDYSNVSARSLAEDIAEGFTLLPTTDIALNLGLDDYTICNIIATVSIAIPKDPENLNGEFINTNHYVLKAKDPDLNQNTSPEIAEPFFQIVPYNYEHLHIVFE